MEAPALARVETLLHYGIDDEGDLYPYGWPDSESPPTALVLRTEGASVVHWHRGTDRNLRRWLEPRMLPDRLPASTAGPRSWALRRTTWRTYLLPSSPTPVAGPPAQRHGGHRIVFLDGRPVAWAWTTVGHGRAEEGWIETIPAFRRRGHGRTALSAWAGDVHHRGRIAMVRVPTKNRGGARFLLAVGAEPIATVEEYRTDPAPLERSRLVNAVPAPAA